MKRITTQEAYYRKKGLSVTSVKDTFSGMQPNRSALAELKRYEKIWKSRVASYKAFARELVKEKGVSLDIAYKYIVALENQKEKPGGVLFEDVIFESFFERVGRFPNAETRKKMSEFIGRLRQLVGDEEAARLLADTAENDQDFDVLFTYYENEEASQNLYNLVENIVDKLDQTEYPIAIDELNEFM